VSTEAAADNKIPPRRPLCYTVTGSSSGLIAVITAHSFLIEVTQNGF
jgi:hypothetical protein